MLIFAPTRRDSVRAVVCVSDSMTHEIERLSVPFLICKVRESYCAGLCAVCSY